MSHTALQRMNYMVDNAQQYTRKGRYANTSKEEEVIYSLVLLLHVTANIDYLQNVVVGTELQCTNVDLDVVFQEILS